MKYFRILIIFLFIVFFSFDFYSQGNTCATATDLGTISSNTCVTGTTAGATQDLGNASYCTSSPTGGGVEDNDVWYKFTTPSGSAPSCWTFNATRGTATGDMMLRVFKSCYTPVGSSGVASAGSSYVCSSNSYMDISSAAFTPADWTAGTTYYIQLDTRGTSSGEGTVNLCIKPNMTQAANDLCSSPIAIGTASMQTDNASSGCEYSYSATQDASVTPAQLCAGSLENVSWYSFTAQSTGAAITVTFSNIQCNGGGGGFQLGMFKGTCASKTSLGCTSGSSGTVIATIPAASVTAGATYLFAMDGNAGSNCHFIIQGTNIVPLPIELIYFNATPKNSVVDINWETASEKNNDYFTIERSKDAINFEPIGKVKGAGNSFNQRQYYLQDKNPLEGISYYQLKQTDFDGKVSYSSVQSVTRDFKEQFDFSVFPNPSGKNDEVTLKFLTKENDVINVIITDITGKILSEKELKMTSNPNTQIELKHHFESGIYFIKATNKTGYLVNQKLIVN